MRDHQTEHLSKINKNRMSVIINWYNNIPIFTKYWLSITITTSVLARFGVLPAHFLFLHSSLVVRHLQVRFKD